MKMKQMAYQKMSVAVYMFIYNNFEETFAA